MNRSRVMAVGLALVMAPGLAGCWSGNDAATTVQSASGDGTQVTTSDITVDGATLVAGDPGSGKASFLGTIYNPTREADELVSVSADGVAGKLTPASVPIKGLQAVAIQAGRAVSAEFIGLDAKAGEYVDVTLSFTNASAQTFPVLIVPPSGFYAEAAPEGTKPIPVKVNEKSAHGAEEAEAGQEAAGETPTGAAPASDAAAEQSQGEGAADESATP